MKLYEDLLDVSKVSELVSLVNDLRATGRKGQFQGKFTNALFLIGGLLFFLLRVSVELTLHMIVCKFLPSEI